MTTTWRVRRVPHDTLWRLAMYHVQIVEDKAARNEHTDIRYDGMSAVIALAFSIEAILNFVGERKLGADWKERASYKQKMSALEKRLDFKCIKTDQPFRTLEALKEARDKMAHGKPADFEVTAEGTNEVAAAMQTEWSPNITVQAVLAAAAEVSQFKEFLFKRARVKPGTGFTSASSEGE